MSSQCTVIVYLYIFTISIRLPEYSCFEISETLQGLKLRKYFRGQVGLYQINFGSPHNLLGANQAHIVHLPPRLRGALRQGVAQGPRKPWDKWCKILHFGHFLAAKLAIQEL